MCVDDERQQGMMTIWQKTTKGDELWNRTIVLCYNDMTIVSAMKLETALR